MKYECQDCGNVFDQSEARNATVWTIKGHPVEGVDTCPKCHSENLKEDYVEPEQEEDRELTAEDKSEQRGEYWMEVERGN